MTKPAKAMQNIITHFLLCARQYPHHTAVIQGHRQITYNELLTMVQQYASALLEKGLKKGDRVLVLVPMSIDLYKVLLSLFYVGLIPVFPDEWAGLERLNQCCRKVPCQALVHTYKTGIVRFLSKEVRNIPVTIRSGKTSGKHLMQAPAEVDQASTALITLTTGSTGSPKAANRTHQYLHEQYHALREMIAPTPRDTDLVSLPIVLLLNLGTGATSVIPAVPTHQLNVRNCRKLAAQIQVNSVNRITASPHVVTSLAHYVRKKGAASGIIKRIFTGGGPVYPADAQEIQQAFPASETTVIYGSTEAEPISSVDVTEIITDGHMLRGTGLIAGYPFHKIRVVIIPISHEPLQSINNLPPGEIGEIVVSGPHVLQSYYNSDLAFKQNKIVVDGVCWHRTGDGGFLDTDGRLYLTGRIRNMIKTGSGWVSPFVSEYKLAQIKGVKKGTVIQKDHTIMVVVEADHKHDITADILRFLPVLASNIKIVKKIPLDKRHHTKIDYSRLIKLV